MLNILPGFNVYLILLFGKGPFSIELMYISTAYLICLKIIAKSYSVNSLQ